VFFWWGFFCVWFWFFFFCGGGFFWVWWFFLCSSRAYSCRHWVWENHFPFPLFRLPPPRKGLPVSMPFSASFSDVISSRRRSFPSFAPQKKVERRRSTFSPPFLSSGSNLSSALAAPRIVLWLRLRPTLRFSLFPPHASSAQPFPPPLHPLSVPLCKTQRPSPFFVKGF